VIADIRKTEKLPVVLGGDLNEMLNTDVLGPLTVASDLFTLTAGDPHGPPRSADTDRQYRKEMASRNHSR